MKPAENLVADRVDAIIGTASEQRPKARAEVHRKRATAFGARLVETLLAARPTGTTVEGVLLSRARRQGSSWRQTR